MRKCLYLAKPAGSWFGGSTLSCEVFERMDADYKRFCKALGAHIKELRKARGISNWDLRATHGVNDAQWRRYERGGGLTIELLLKVAAILGVSAGELLDGAREPASAEVMDVQAGQQTNVAKKAVAKQAARKS